MNKKIEFDEGWHKENPNNVKCPECKSLDVEFLWDHYEVVGMNCNNCGEGILEKVARSPRPFKGGDEWRIIKYK